uniref:Uncharacterized protein n=1 Tax=Panagrolaimus davidi TaxID=227884 RepID=A0A914QGQ6_9BILA
MTVLGYFHRELATSVVYNSTLQTEMSEINDTKRVLFKGMQYIGPVCMGFGAFAMIIACVMTLESRDRHAQIIQEESSEYRKLQKSKSDTEGTKTSLLSPFDENVEIIDEVSKNNNNSNNSSKKKIENNNGSKKHAEKENVKVTPHPVSCPNGHTSLSSSGEKCTSLPLTSPRHHQQQTQIYRPTTLSASTSPIELSVHRFLNVNIRKPRGPAPIAEADSFLDLSVIQTPNGYPSSSSQKRSSVRSLVESSD